MLGYEAINESICRNKVQLIILLGLRTLVSLPRSRFLDVTQRCVTALRDIQKSAARETTPWWRLLEVFLVISNVTTYK